MRIRGIQISDYYTGMCNQMIQFFHGVIRSIEDNIDVVVVEDFKTDLYSNTYRPFDTIINMDTFSDYVYNHYGVVIVGKHQLDMAITKVVYGTMTSFVDITEKFIDRYVEDHHLLLPGDTSLNTLINDPAPYKKKSIRITYQIKKGFEITKHYTEENKTINCHLKGIVYNHYPHWPKQIKWMETLLQKCPFHPTFYQKMLYTEDKIVHVIHARLEYDASKHWARENKMGEEEFYNYISSQYIKAIEEHMIGGIIMVLTYHEDNRVIEWLKETKRPYIFIKKNTSQGREWNAVIDMAMCEKYGNGVFIGNFDIYRMQGSTYSYFLMKKCDFQKQILIDIERIKEEPLILTNSSV